MVAFWLHKVSLPQALGPHMPPQGAGGDSLIPWPGFTSPRFELKVRWLQTLNRHWAEDVVQDRLWLHPLACLARSWMCTGQLQHRQSKSPLQAASRDTRKLNLYLARRKKRNRRKNSASGSHKPNNHTAKQGEGLEQGATRWALQLILTAQTAQDCSGTEIEELGSIGIKEHRIYGETPGQSSGSPSWPSSINGRSRPGFRVEKHQKRLSWHGVGQRDGYSALVQIRAQASPCYADWRNPQPRREEGCSRNTGAVLQDANPLCFLPWHQSCLL